MMNAKHLLLFAALLFVAIMAQQITLNEDEEEVVMEYDLQDQVSTLSVAYSTDFFVWPMTNGYNTVIFKDGTQKTLETVWAGYAAWNSVTGVTSKIASIKTAGRVPFIHSYQFGDNGLRTSTDFSKALAFDTAMAKAIGTSFAIVNLETEWDVDAVYALLTSGAGIQNFKDRIATYRTYAKNAFLISSPGLWKSTASYTAFAPVDALLNGRGTLYHATSSSTTCTKRSDGTFYTDGKSVTDASKVRNALGDLTTKMTSAWGTQATPKFITGDIAVTSCGWGAAGQAQIIKSIVTDMKCLFKSGWRGMVMRNVAPTSDGEKFMGIGNENGFVYSTNTATTAQLAAGLTLAKGLITGATSAACTVTAAFTVTKQSGSGNYWIQVKIDPSSDVASVKATWSSGSATLAAASWGGGEFVASSSNIPTGSTVSFAIVSKATGTTVTKTLVW